MQDFSPVTVVISQWPGRSPARRQLEADLAARLARQAELELCVVPHIYDLDPQNAAVQMLRSKEHSLIVLAWLYPRAARWLLYSFGIDGRFYFCKLNEADLDKTDGSATAEVAAQTDAESSATASDCPSGQEPSAQIGRVLTQRPLSCIRLRPEISVDSYVEEVLRLAERFRTIERSEAFSRPGSSADEPPPNSTPRGDRQLTATSAHPGSWASLAEQSEWLSNAAVPRDAYPTRRRWYPVIDYDRCTHCMECLDFCLFGVYDVAEDGRLVVKEPDSCRPGCPACARVCPEAAILFPAHRNCTIAGGPGRLEDLRLDLSEILGGNLNCSAAELAKRERRLSRHGKQAANGPQPHTQKADLTSEDQTLVQHQASQPPADELDQLIDELDGLDL